MLYNIKKIISNKTGLGLLFPYFDIVLPNPLFALVHITLKCNRECSWCYERRDAFYKSFSNHMSIGMFRKVLSCFKGSKPHLHIYGGEPLSHPEFPRFLEYCKAGNFRPSLTTNGDYLDQYSELIIGSSLSQVNISVNAVIRADGSLNAPFQSKIRDFLERNQGRKIINLNYTIEPGTYGYLEEAAAFLTDGLRKNSFSVFVVQHFNSELTTGSGKSGFDICKLVDVLSRLRKTRLRSRLLFLPNIKIEDLEKYYATGTVFRNKCYVPWMGLSIYPDLTIAAGGGVFGCNRVLGNLNETGILDIWRSARFKDFRLRLARDGLPKECNRCCHKIYY
jgi:MoaA/NifB/PqqE/SkfB family radical SAM enzyme